MTVNIRITTTVVIIITTVLLRLIIITSIITIIIIVIKIITNLSNSDFHALSDIIVGLKFT